MPRFEDLHPVRWRRTRPFARSMVTRIGRSCPSGVMDARTLDETADEVGHAYNRSIAELPFADRPSDSRIPMREMSLALYAARFFTLGRNAFYLSRGLAKALENTSLAGVRIGDVKIPHRFFYLSFGGLDCGHLDAPANGIEGAYVDTTMPGSWQVVLTSRPADPHGSWPGTVEPYLYLPLKLEDGVDPSFEDLLDAAISSGEIKVAEADVAGPELQDEDVDLGPVVDELGNVVVGSVVDVRRRKDVEETVRNRNAFPGARKALAVLFNALAWLTAEPDDAARAPEWGDDVDAGAVADLSSPLKGRRRRAEASLLDRGFVPIRILGANVPDPTMTDDRSEGASGSLSHAHWRIGHWRRQVYGPGRSGRRMKWIAPVLVRADLRFDPDRGGHAYVIGA